jgi:hypothetical protein
MTSAKLNYTTSPTFGLNGLQGLTQNDYYWCRHSDGTRFIAKLENSSWWTMGYPAPINVTRDQVICKVQAPEN